jgi:hypothetical protein
VAQWFWEKHGLKTRLISADGGGWDPLQALIDQGIIEAWPITLWPHRIEAIDLACQGYWPVDLHDPSKGYHKPVEISVDKIGLVAIEGLTSIGSHIMSALKTPNVTLSQDPSYVLTDGSTKYAGGSMAAYGFVQDRAYDFVMKSHMIPYVKKVLWTALEGRGEEEGTRIPVFGPNIEGKKAIGKAGQWFGNMIHMEAVGTTTQDEKTKQLEVSTDVWMYLRPHADPNSKIVFPAKIRVPFQMVADIPDRVCLPFRKTTPNLATVYQAIEELQKRAAKQFDQHIKETTGVTI